MTNIIAAEIAATADAIRDADELVTDGQFILIRKLPTTDTCLGYYNDGPCSHCEGN